MGSRGQALKKGGFTAYNYKTLMRYNNTRFIVQKDFAKNNVKIPEMSNSNFRFHAKHNLQSKYQEEKKK